MRLYSKLDKGGSASQNCDSEVAESLSAVAEDQDTDGAKSERRTGSHRESACACISEQSHLLKTVGWVSAALGAVALGLIVVRELRLRYKFNRRTPYDLYAHSGDELSDADFFVGI